MKKMGKKMLSLLLASLMTFTVILAPTSALAAEISLDQPMPDSDLVYSTNEADFEEIEYEYVESQDVEIYVTDGYKPISNAAVEFNGIAKTTREDGTVLYRNVPTKESLYSVSVSAPDYGTKESDIYVENYIKKNTEAVRKFTVSFWMPPDDTDKSVDSEGVQTYSQESYPEMLSDSENDWTSNGVNTWVESAECPLKYTDYVMRLHYREIICVDNKLYLQNTEDQCLSMYDIATDTWSQSAKAPESMKLWPSRTDLFREYNGTIYIMAVNNGAVLAYNMDSDSWAIGQSYPWAGSPCKGGQIINGDIYLHGKIYGSSSYKYVMSTYTIWNNTWKLGAYFDDYTKEDLYETACYNVESLFYTLWSDDSSGGVKGSTRLLVYDMYAKKWEEISDWYDDYSRLNLEGPEGNRTYKEWVRGCSVLYGYQIVFIGGSEHFDTCRDVVSYNLSTRRWSTLPPLPVRLADATAIAVGSNIYVMGGVSGTTTESPGVYDTKSFFIYDGTTKTWSQGPDLNYPRNANRSLYADGKLITWGNDEGNATKYDPIIEMFALGIYATSVTPITKSITVSVNTSADTLLGKLKNAHADVVFNDGSTDIVPIVWDAESFDGTVRGVHSLYGDLKIDPWVPGGVVMPRTKVEMEVIVQASVISIDKENAILVQGSSKQEIADHLAEKYPEATVNLTGGTTENIPVTWNTSSVNGDVCKSYTVTGTLDFTDYPYITCAEYTKPQITVQIVPKIISIAEIEGVSIPAGTSIEGLQAQLEEKRPQAAVELSNSTTDTCNISWDVTNSEYTEDSEIGKTYTIQGSLDLSEKTNMLNPDSYQATVQITVANPVIMSVSELEKIDVIYGTTAEELQTKLEAERPQVNVTLIDGSPVFLPITWDVANSDYKGSKYITYTIYGELDITDKNILNPEGLKAEIKVTVIPDPNLEIKDVEPEEISVNQHILLAPTEKQNEFGTPTTVKPPEFVSIALKNNKSVQLPVKWHVEDFDPAAVGEQTITGELVLDGSGGITNPEGKQASLVITVQARDYTLWQASPKSVTVEVLPGTTLKEINEMLETEGKNELAADAFDMVTDYEVWTFCSFTLDEAKNPDWAEQMDVPNAEGYTLTATLPDNFIPLSEDEPGPIEVKVTVAQPLPIIAVDSVEINEYQSVAPKHFDNLPEQVAVTLEGGLKVQVDVEWDMSTYNKDAAGDQPVIGKLVNLPSKAKQPEGEEFTGLMTIHVIPVNYEVTGRSSDNLYEPDAALTLAEITELLKPTQIFEITSVTEGITLTTDYEVPVTLEDEKNPDFDPKTADAYVISGTMSFPENINAEAYSEYDEILLDTQPVKILRFESSGVMVREGTPFEEIKKPDTVMAVLDVVGPDEKNKTETLKVDWSSEGYNPYPPDLTDDNTVTMCVYGGIAEKPQYIVTPTIRPALSITVGREFDIVSISPSRFPETGVMNVNLGSTLEDIYNQLERHTVQLNLRSTNGVLSTAEVTFELREEDNTDFDPMSLGASTLKAYIELDDNVKNPDNQKVEIVVQTKKYNITSTKVARVTGIVSGTAFEDVPMPEMAEAVRDDGVTEAVTVASWDGSKYNPTKIGTQVVSGTFADPLPVHLENPDNRQPKAFVSVVNPTVQILSMEQVFAVPQARLMSLNTEEESVEGYVEYKYRVKLQHEDGSVTEEIISMYTQAK